MEKLIIRKIIEIKINLKINKVNAYTNFVIVEIRNDKPP